MISMQRLLPAITEAGHLAQQYYRQGTKLGARLKADRSVVTAADTAVEGLLRQAIQQLFPEANVLGEEHGIAYDPGKPYTFVIDPIDGTATFASGTPCWAICVGVLDRALQPVAGIVSAPAWDSLFVADLDPQSPATHNGVPLPQAGRPEPVDSNTTIITDSRLYQTHQLQGFTGKCRNFGSAALHICLVAQQSGFVLAHACPVYIWDIAAAHAIAARVGLSVQYIDGRPLHYEPLIAGSPTLGHTVAGHPEMLATLLPAFVPVASMPV
ncbi:MAG: inositol monophosphatase [Candidatus Tectimicrobiota bacterium]